MNEMLQLKDTDWMNVYENKTHIYLVYKRPISDLERNLQTGKWERLEEDIPMQMDIKRKQEYKYIFYQINQSLKIYIMRQRRTLHNS